MSLTVLLAYLFSGMSLQAAEPCVPLPESFGYQDLRTTIESCKVRSIGELLPQLPEEYRRRYTFMYKGHSLQAATPDFPRVILYGKDARMIMTFSGDPSQPGATRVELMEANAKNKNFELGSIDLDPSKGAPQFSRDASKCMSCHGNPPRPNWEPYNTWLGAYGSVSRNYRDIIKKGSLEDKYYQSFLSSNRNSGRYAHLPQRPSSNLFSEEDGGAPPGTGGSREIKNIYVVRNGSLEAPNSTLTKLLSGLNAARIVAELKSNPNFKFFKNAIVGLAGGCPNVAYDFYPASIRSSGPSFDQTESLIRNRLQSQGSARVAEASGFNGESPNSDFRFFPEAVDADPLSNMDGIRRQVEWKFLSDRMGANFENWSMGFDRADYTFHMGYGESDFTIVQEVKRQIAPEMPDVSRFKRFKTEECSELARKSKQALSSIEFGSGSFSPETLDKVLACRPKDGELPMSKQARDTMNLCLTASSRMAMDPPKALNSCIACHSGPNAEALQIPFHDPEALAKQMPALKVKLEHVLKSSDPQIRMPRNRPTLSSDEVEALLNYFKTLNAN